MKRILWESDYEAVFNNLTDDDAIKMHYPARIRNIEASVKWNFESKWNGTHSLNSQEVSPTDNHYVLPSTSFMILLFWIVFVIIGLIRKISEEILLIRQRLDQVITLDLNLVLKNGYSKFKRTKV